jgi:ASC-1-like (ASCH) protein
MYVLETDATVCGMIHIVGKRQGTYKISPLIISSAYRGTSGLGSQLLEFAERYARSQRARQMYCTVAEQNTVALQFFVRKGYIPAGRSDSHYKPGVTEVMLFKSLTTIDAAEQFDRPNISVVPCEESHEPAVRKLLLDILPRSFDGIDDAWVDSLFQGYKRRLSIDINQKYKIIYVAVDRSGAVLGVAGATPKKGEPIKLMPLVATMLPAFVALLSDVPYLLKFYGRKVYVHIIPTSSETVFLQQRGWRLDAALPDAYHVGCVTQQWSLDLDHPEFMRTMRVKKQYLDLIKSGRKTLEVRVGYESIKTIQPGEKIKLMSHAEAETICVKDVRSYTSFEDMLKHESSASIAPDVGQERVLPLLREIYPPDREKLGVVVLDIERWQPSH